MSSRRSDFDPNGGPPTESLDEGSVDGSDDGYVADDYLVLEDEFATLLAL